MNEDSTSYRRILRSTSIVGGATAGSIVIGLIRTKIVTLLIGPVGFGLFGLFNAVVMTGSMLAGLGIGSSGVREVAVVAGDDRAAGRVRAALWSLTWLLGLAGGAAVWLFRHPIARWAEAGDAQADAVGLLGLGVLLNVVAASQFAVLQGYQRIGDVGRVKIYGALITAVVAVAAVYFIPYYGIALALVATPVGIIAVALIYGRDLPRWRWREVRLRSLAPEWRALVAVGIGFMLWTLTQSATQIAVRSIIIAAAPSAQAGLFEAGLFNAAYTVSINWQVLILAAMLNDYLPRLSAVAHDQAAVRGMADQQMHVALLLSAPLIAGLMGAAPLVLRILYSAEFTGADDLLRWQLAGDALKIAGWALSFVLLARKDMALFLFAEATFTGVYLGALHLLLPALGLDAAGIAYFAGYAVYVLLVAAICWRRHGVTVSAANLRLVALLLAVLVALIALGYWSVLAAFVAGSVAALGFAVLALRQLAGATGAIPPRVQALARRFRLL